ncbi:MAG: FAD-dependent oxidoreductase [Bacteroidota bacterium]
MVLSCKEDTKHDQVDIVVYGGTSGAVIAAVQAKKMGKSVIIVCPDIHLGGLTSGGLGYTDTGNKAVIGGLSREFYHRVYNYYQDPDTWKWQSREEYGNKGQGTPAIDGANKTQWIFEPHIAERVFEDFINDYKIPVFRDEWLDRENGVELKEGKIVSITTHSGNTYQANIFIDATYEGDLMAAAGVNYHVGREANEVYGEDWNGVQTGVLHHKHFFKDKISPYWVPGDSSSGVLPRISLENPGEFGSGDKKIQAYCYRLCMSNHPDNRVPFPRPADYDSTQYEILLRVFNGPSFEMHNDWFGKFDTIPNRKTDTNNRGPVSSDNIGMNYDYPEASYERRKEILDEHISYQQGLLWFAANDPRVRKDVHDEMQNWGLARDEFVDNDNWPHQIYVREARRMIGDFVLTEHELLGKRPTPKSIGMGSYTIDSHNIQRYITPEGYVQNEGDIGVHVKPYKIPLGCILPKRNECSNLLVPVAVSSSHIAFGSIRMEPVFMILGQSAATLAGLALEYGKGIHEIEYATLSARLLDDNQVLTYED